MTRWQNTLRASVWQHQMLHCYTRCSGTETSFRIILTSSRRQRQTSPRSRRERTYWDLYGETSSRSKASKPTAAFCVSFALVFNTKFPIQGSKFDRNFCVSVWISQFLPQSELLFVSGGSNWFKYSWANMYDIWALENMRARVWENKVCWRKRNGSWSKW